MSFLESIYDKWLQENGKNHIMRGMNDVYYAFVIGVVKSGVLRRLTHVARIVPEKKHTKFWLENPKDDT
jgi:hypothetical protein